LIYIHTHHDTYTDTVHTNLYSAKNRENESVALSRGDLRFDLSVYETDMPMLIMRELINYITEN